MCAHATTKLFREASLPDPSREPTSISRKKYVGGLATAKPVEEGMESGKEA